MLKSPDPLLRELQVFLSEPRLQSCLVFSFTICKYMTSATAQVTSIKSLKKKCLDAASSVAWRLWDDQISSLEVQGKFHSIVELEREEGSWKKILNFGLPSGQLSFLLRAGSDTLPHTLNLKRWKIQCASYAYHQDLPQPTIAMDALQPFIKVTTHGSTTQFGNRFSSASSPSFFWSASSTLTLRVQSNPTAYIATPLSACSSVLSLQVPIESLVCKHCRCDITRLPANPNYIPTCKWRKGSTLQDSGNYDVSREGLPHE